MRVLVVSTTANGQLEIPADIDQAGWWNGGSRLGDPFGATVVAAHVDSFTQGLGRFDELLSMRPGEIVVLRSKHRAQTYTVSSAGLVAKESLSSKSRLFAGSGDPRLVLITCGGTYLPSQGGYQDNMVVIARPSGPVVDVRPPGSR